MAKIKDTLTAALSHHRGQNPFTRGLMAARQRLRDSEWLLNRYNQL